MDTVGTWEAGDGAQGWRLTEPWGRRRDRRRGARPHRRPAVVGTAAAVTAGLRPRRGDPRRPGRLPGLVEELARLGGDRLGRRRAGGRRRGGPRRARRRDLGAGPHRVRVRPGAQPVLRGGRRHRGGRRGRRRGPARGGRRGRPRRPARRRAGLPPPARRRRHPGADPRRGGRRGRDGSGGPSATAQAEEALGAYGTDVATVAGWLGDVVATVAYDPTPPSRTTPGCSSGPPSPTRPRPPTLRRRAWPPRSRRTAAWRSPPGSVMRRARRAARGRRRRPRAAGRHPSEGRARATTRPGPRPLDGLEGEPVAYLDVRALVGALVPALLASATELEPRRTGRAWTCSRPSTGSSMTTARSDDGLDTHAASASAGARTCVPLDLDAASEPAGRRPRPAGGPRGPHRPGRGPSATWAVTWAATWAADLGTDLGGDLGRTPAGPAAHYGDDPGARRPVGRVRRRRRRRPATTCTTPRRTTAAYEQFALTCGGRTEEVLGSCTAVDGRAVRGSA